MDNIFDLNQCDTPTLQKLISNCGTVEWFRGSWDILHPAGLPADADIQSKNAGIRNNEDPESRDAEIARGTFEVLDLINAQPTSFSLIDTAIMRLHGDMLKHSLRDAEHRGKFRGDLAESTRLLLETTQIHLLRGDESALITISFFRSGFIELMPFITGNRQLANIIAYILLIQKGYRFVNQLPLIDALNNPPESVNDDPFLLLTEVLAQLILTHENDKRHAAGKAYLSPRRQTLVACIQEHAPMKISDIMLFFPNDSRNTIKKDLLFLRENEFIEINGEGRGMSYMVMTK